jgi:hypothetical protein
MTPSIDASSLCAGMNKTTGSSRRIPAGSDLVTGTASGRGSLRRPNAPGDGMKSATPPVTSEYTVFIACAMTAAASAADASKPTATNAADAAAS